MVIDSPPGWPFLTTVSVVALISFYGTSVPHWYVETVIFMVLAWGSLGLYWLIRVIMMVWTAGWAMMAARLFRWMPAPLIFVGVVAALSVNGPFWVRFALSESSMEGYAKTIAEGGSHSPDGQWLGLYYVDGKYSSGGEAIPGGAQFLVTDLGLIPSKGFAWLPGGHPPSDDVYDRYTHLTGPWYGVESWDGW